MSYVDEATLSKFSKLAPAYSFEFGGDDDTVKYKDIKPIITPRDEQCAYLCGLFKGDHKEPFYIDTDIWSICYLSHNLDVILKFKPASADEIESIKLHFFS